MNSDTLTRIALAVALTVLLTLAVDAQLVTTETFYGGDAEILYEEGFVDNLRKHPEGGVSLFDMILVENDAPGAGCSEKGVWTDVIWGKNQARKILYLDDIRAKKAFLVLFINNAPLPSHPLTFTVNGHQGQMLIENGEVYRWAEFPVSALKKGENVIELSCPEAKNEKEGWSLYVARADEFADGGGDPSEVGKTSFKSLDGGVTWQQSPFTSEGEPHSSFTVHLSKPEDKEGTEWKQDSFMQDAAVPVEYSVRLSLDAYRPEGSLTSPVIDLWRGNNDDFFVPLRRIIHVTFEVEAEVPEGSQVIYYVRRGTSPDPYSEDWEIYQKVGSGATLNVKFDGESFNRRYAQVRAVLTTKNPVVSPIIKRVQVKATVQNQVPVTKNIFVTRCENLEMRYPSVAWEWESWDRPEYAELRERENLDELTAGARTEFEAQCRLMEHATKRWQYGGPLPDYPEWDAISILDRIDKSGSGGMCIQGNNFLGGMCLAYGWQARHVNITAHEICEVWNNDYGKWIYIDGYFVNHYLFDKETGEPLSILEAHQKLLDFRWPDRAIDWMKDDMRWGDVEEQDLPVGLGVPGPRDKGHNGFELVAFIRMVPRNNWYEKPYPRPLSHGSSWWPWDGYINWYDERTPPKRQYTHHTDRPQDMWPDLNKVHVDATSGNGDDRLFLRFQTYTPNFSHYEVNVDNTGWQETGERWAWYLRPGKNTLEVRAVNKLGATGKPSVIHLNYAPLPR